MGEDTKEIYNATHRHVVETEPGRKMREFLWSEFGGYVGQLSWCTVDQLETLGVRAGLAPDVRVLDLCCGSGGTSLHLAKRFGCSVVGVDYSDVAIELARRAATNAGANDQVEFVHGDALDLPFDQDEFDAVISVDSLVIVPRRWKAIHEIARVLKPGGRLSFSDEVIVGKVPRDKEVLQAMNVYGRLYPETPGTYRRLLAESGFRDVQLEETTETFIRISDRWAEAYRRYEEGLREVLGGQLFDDGLRFFEVLRDEGLRGSLGQIRLSATQ